MADGKYGTLYTAKVVEAMLEVAHHHGEAAGRASAGGRTIGRDGDMLPLLPETAAELAAEAGVPMEIPAEEPVFVLRAQDEVTPEVVQDYLGRCRDRGAPPEHIGAIREQYARIEAWRADHPDRVKVAD